MRSAYRALDKNAIQWATRMALDVAKAGLYNAQRYEADPDKAQRVQEHRCRACFYFRHSRVAGQAFTQWACGVCGTEAMHANTATPRVCSGCAEAYGLCVQCGGDLWMNVSRRSYPEPASPLPDQRDGADA